MLNRKQKEITALELQENYKLLDISDKQILNDLQFTPEQFLAALTVSEETNGYDVWKLRDYLIEMLTKNHKEVYPFSILTNNIWFHYHKTW